MDSRPKSEEFPPANWVPESRLMTLSIQTTSKEKYQHQTSISSWWLQLFGKNTTVKSYHLHLKPPPTLPPF